MAKLTELPETLTLPTNAKVYVVDEDDTTDDPSGSSKQMDAALLGGGGGTTSKVEIETITNTVAGEFNFTGIPTNYRRLIVQGWLQASTTLADQVLCELNGVTTGYHRQSAGGNDGGASFSEYAGPDVLYIAGTDLGNVSPAFLEIEDYAGGNNKTIVGRSMAASTATSIYGGHSFVQSSVSDAVTSLKLRGLASSLTGSLTLYGEY